MPSKHSSAAIEEILRARREARVNQASIDLERLNKHKRAMALLRDPQKRPLVESFAQNEINRWDSLGLCSERYVVVWREWLRLPLQQLEHVMLQPDGIGPAMRQNSPFYGELFQV